MSDSKEIAVITPQAAKSRALEQIRKHKSDGALIYTRPEDLETQGTFFPVPTCVPASPEDFHSISGGKLMPKSHHTELIARATGVSIVDTTTTQDGPFRFFGKARGRRRMPDGTFLERTAEYSFDAELRAEEDFINDQSSDRPKYTSDVAKRKHVLELAKYGTARAETGASLRVIRKLAGIPTAFDRRDIQKAMVFVRIELNTDRLLQDPDLRQAAIQNAMGVKVELFGPREQEIPAALPEPGDEDAEDQVENGKPLTIHDDDVPWEEETEVDRLRRWFETTLAADEIPEKTRTWIRELLDGEEGHDEVVLAKYKETIEKRLEARKGGAA